MEYFEAIDNYFFPVFSEFKSVLSVQLTIPPEVLLLKTNPVVLFCSIVYRIELYDLPKRDNNLREEQNSIKLHSRGLLG